jgi:hypothetical protein
VMFLSWLWGVLKLGAVLLGGIASGPV